MIKEIPGNIWIGRWISACFMNKVDDAVMAPYFRKNFWVTKPVKSAMLYICGLGYYNASINGASVLNEVLSQPYTKYDSTLLYSSYDVKNSLEEGENVIGVVLGNGWYNCFTKDVWNSREATWRSLPKLIAELHIEFSDGSKNIVKSDSSWKCSDGSIIFNGIRNGEYYDARLQNPGWNTKDFDDCSWGGAKIARSPGGILKPFKAQPIRETRRFLPLKSWKTPEGSTVYDMGINMAGYCKIGFKGPIGTQITVKYSELLGEDGIHINQKSISGFVRSGEFQTDKYTKGTNDIEFWNPSFVYHGFQYVEISGNEGPAEVEAVIVHTDFEQVGQFECSDDILNALYKASNQATISNFHGLPTDDPHREKNAWTGDISLSTEQMLFNYDVAPILKKWLGDIRDSQKPDGSLPCVVPSTGWGYNWGNGPDWSSALTLIPWYIYLYTGDKEVLVDNYKAIKLHFGFMEGMSEDGIVNYGIGDWCPPFEGRALSVTMSSFKCPVEVTDTAYYFNAADTLSKIASVLNCEEDSKYYAEKAEDIKIAFRKHFYDEESYNVLGDCQTSIATMLYQKLSDNEEIIELTKVLVEMIKENDYHQDTGILGNKYLHNVLGEAGLMDLSLKMILNPTYPSFRNWIDRGATTLWECWNGEGSRNHHMFSDFIAVFFKYLAGIKPDENKPGFKSIIMEPQIKCGLEWVKASHKTQYGTIKCYWKTEGNLVSFEVTVPEGCTAYFNLPGKKESVQELGSGEHCFEVRL